jgi:hypothetical protein
MPRPSVPGPSSGEYVEKHNGFLYFDDVRLAADCSQGTHLEHTVIDISDIETVEVGDEVVLMRRQGSETITAEELASCYGVPLMELVIRLASSLPRLYDREDGDCQSRWFISQRGPSRPEPPAPF